MEISRFDQQTLVGQADQSLDVILFGIFWIAKDDDIPSIWFRNVIRKFADQDTVAAKRILIPISFRVESLSITTDWAGGCHDAFRFSRFDTCIDTVAEAALRTDDILVLSLQRWGHRSRRDYKCLSFECLEKQGQHDCNDDGFHRLPNAGIAKPVTDTAGRIRHRGG